MQWPRLQRLGLVVCMLLYAFLSTSALRAEPSVATDAERVAPSVNANGLPGLWNLASPEPRQERLLLSGAAQYGFTESRSSAPGSHHRLGLQLNASARLAPWFVLGASSRIRLDLHADDGFGPDGATAIESLLTALVGTAITPRLHLGAEVSAQFVDAPSVGQSLANPVVQAVALGQYGLVGSRVQWLGRLGYRHDRSGRTVANAELFRPGDRLALGVSDFDALIWGTGAQYPIGRSSVFGELGGAVLVGAGAPSLLQSPWALTGGYRHAVRAGMSWTTALSVSLSQARTAQEPFVTMPVQPRASLFTGLAFQFGGEKLSVERPPSTIEQPPEPEPKALALVEVRVTSPEGDPLSDAVVTLQAKGQPSISVQHSHLQSYRREAVEPGMYTLEVKAERLVTDRRPVEVVPGTTTVQVRMQDAGATGQIRGEVRSFSGEGLLATIVVQPLGTRTMTSDQGRFELDVPPGTYEVVLSADGHQSQRRTVHVATGGVVVLHADMRRGMP